MKKIFTWIIGAIFIAANFSMKPETASYKKSIYEVSDTTKPAPKLYAMAMSIEEWQLWLNYHTYIANQLKTSDLPSKQVTFMVDSLIIPMQTEISRQISPQLSATNTMMKPQKDSTKKK